MMADKNDPVLVNQSPLPAPVAAAMRYLVVIAGAIPILMTLIGDKNVVGVVAYFNGEQGVQFIAALTSLVTLVYGLYRTYSTRKKYIAAADAAPNSEFLVVHKGSKS